MIRSSKGRFFKKRFSKLNFPKTVLVTIIANSKKMKMKKSHLPMIFLKYCSPYPIFLKFHFFPSKKGVGLGQGRELFVFI